MKKVLLRGPVLSQSGYGEHTRQIFRYLLTKKDVDVSVQITPWGVTPWHLDENYYGGLIGEAIKRSHVKPGEIYDVSFQVQLPNEWDTSVAKYNVGVTAAVETTNANPMWTVTHCEKMDKVIVPSIHSKKSLTNSGDTSTDINVVPESYYDELLEEGKDLDLGLCTSFNFLTIGVLTGLTPDTDRKNLLYLIKWFCEEFKDDSDVGLIIKTSAGRETTLDRNNTKTLLKNVLNEIGYNGVPKIYLLHGSMTREDMTSLYKHEKVKAFLSLTKGEGFGLPHLEAAVSGLPVIATNWSAHKEFLDKGKWIKVDYDLQKIPQSRVDGSIFLENSKWAIAKEKDLKKKIRTFRQKPDAPKKWAEDLSKKLIEAYSQDTVNSLYDEVVGDILR